MGGDVTVVSAPGRGSTFSFSARFPVVVERVLANYWIYQQRFKQSSPSLDALASGLAPVIDAQEFVWHHRRRPYDLAVYQLGNAACHDYMWAYLFRYPGLVVLHDAQLHQARALALLRRLAPRRADYFAELAANHPDAPADLGELVAAGLGGTLYRLWPMLGLVLRAARLAAVHNRRLAERLRAEHPGTHVAWLEMGTGGAEGVQSAECRVRSAELRKELGIPADAVVIGAYGGVTEEKRIPSLLRAVAAQGSRGPSLYVLIVGQRVAHYDVDEDVGALGLESRVHVAGYVPDESLPAWLAAADVCCCLRWPSNGETSASWLRCLAAGRPTIVTALAQERDVPALSAWPDAGQLEGDSERAVAVAVDPLDEEAALPTAIAALARDAALRRTMGGNARRWWAAHHGLPAMADRYAALVAEALSRPTPSPSLPAHLLDSGLGTLDRLLGPFGLPSPL